MINACDRLGNIQYSFNASARYRILFPKGIRYPGLALAKIIELEINRVLDIQTGHGLFKSVPRLALGPSYGMTLLNGDYIVIP